MFHGFFEAQEATSNVVDESFVIKVQDEVWTVSFLFDPSDLQRIPFLGDGKKPAEDNAAIFVPESNTPEKGFFRLIVADGMNPYAGQVPVYQGNLSGGQLASRHLVRSIHTELPIEEALLVGIHGFAQVLKKEGIDPNDSRQFGGAVGAIVEVRWNQSLPEPLMSIFQWGDTQVFWKYLDTRIVEKELLLGTLNQVYAFDVMSDGIYEISDSFAEYAEKFWFMARAGYVNRLEHPYGYGLYNGQLELLPAMTRTTLVASKVPFLFMGSDGFIPMSLSQDAAKVFTLPFDLGLSAVRKDALLRCDNVVTRTPEGVAITLRRNPIQ
jgi:hypothetical protein